MKGRLPAVLYRKQVRAVVIELRADGLPCDVDQHEIRPSERGDLASRPADALSARAVKSAGFTLLPKSLRRLVQPVSRAAHSLGSTEASYRRQTAVEARRGPMEAYAKWLSGEGAGAEVVAFRGRGG